MDVDTSSTRRKNEDRRLILRFSEPRLRAILRTTQKNILYLAIFVLIVGVTTLISGFFRSPFESAIHFALGTLAILFAVLFFRYGRTLDLFLKNESANNLVEAMDMQRNIWIIVNIAITIVTAIALILQI